MLPCILHLNLEVVLMIKVFFYHQNILIIAKRVITKSFGQFEKAGEFYLTKIKYQKLSNCSQNNTFKKLQNFKTCRNGYNLGKQTFKQPNDNLEFRFKLAET